jgi:hypothetical protein
MSSTLDKIIEEVRALPPEEQQQLREQLETIIPSQTEEELEDALERELAAEGVISLPDASADDDDNWQPVEVTGKPLSEMIIEERR